MTNVFAKIAVATLNGYSKSAFCPKFVNQKENITSKLQYAMQETVCTYDFVYMDLKVFL